MPKSSAKDGTVQAVVVSVFALLILVCIFEMRMFTMLLLLGKTRGRHQGDITFLQLLPFVCITLSSWWD